MGLLEALIFTKHNHCSYRVGTIIRLRSGPTRVEDAYLRSMDIWTMSEPFSSTMSCLGSYRAQTIRRYEYGIGKTGHSVSEYIIG